MPRATIDFGIDLGTTNSCIAVSKGTSPEVFRDNEGFEYTPSAVWIDRKGNLHVGRRAKERLDTDTDNAYAEFKSAMGERREYVFQRSGRRFTPQLLSSEVLKGLKTAAEQRTGEHIEAAVITVPAAFDFPQCEATREAASLAGFRESPLLQEPVAAAVAYGFQSESDRVFWLVYDFGGGTFDAALVHMRDESIQVTNHGGDNYLGGKHLDRAIIEELLIPALIKDRPLAGFHIGNPKWSEAIAKLKQQAELAKIRLSREESVDLEVEDLCKDDRGEPVRFEYELTRPQVERLAEPLIIRSINICRKVLAERRLASSDIEKVLLVGGPPLAPYFQRRLGDELGIPLEFELDPLTVVARGAAIFAGTQRLAGGHDSVVAVAGQFALHLFDFKPVGADPEPTIGGRVEAGNGEDVSTHTIEFINTVVHPEWRSGKIGLGPTGGFLTNLWAERRSVNTFAVELRDATGRVQPIVPDRVSYTIGLGISDAPLTHSLGVGLANNEVLFFFEKGRPLPARRREVLRTLAPVQRGATGQSIRIPFVEGQSQRADRNQEIGALQIDASRLKRDVPGGSEIEITIEIDASRILRTWANVPILGDEDFEQVINYNNYREKKDPKALQADLDREKSRLEEARAKAAAAHDQRADEVLSTIDSERLAHDAESALAAAHGDPDAVNRCAQRILDLRLALDKAEDMLEWPALVAEAEKEIEVERGIISVSENRATPEERAKFAALEREIRDTFALRDVDALRRKVKEMDRLGLLIVFRRPEWWMAQFRNLEAKKATMTDRGRADQLLAQGRRTIHNNDVEGLKAAVQQLAALLPMDDAARDRIISSVVR